MDESGGLHGCGKGGFLMLESFLVIVSYVMELSVLMDLLRTFTLGG